MTDIEKMLRAGVTEEEILKQIHSTQEKINKEQAEIEARKQKEAQLQEKISKSRDAAAVAILNYLNAIYDLNEKEATELTPLIKETLKAFENKGKSNKIDFNFSDDLWKKFFRSYFA